MWTPPVKKKKKSGQVLYYIYAEIIKILKGSQKFKCHYRSVSPGPMPGPMLWFFPCPFRAPRSSCISQEAALQGPLLTMWTPPTQSLETQWNQSHTFWHTSAPEVYCTSPGLVKTKWDRQSSSNASNKLLGCPSSVIRFYWAKLQF